MNPDHDLLELARKIRYDLTACQGKLTDLMNGLAALDVPDPARLECGHCGLTFRSTNRLAEHIHVSHDGPVPAAWQRIEAMSDDAERSHA